MENVSNKSCKEKQNTHFIFNNFFSENRAIYETMSKNVVEPERPQMAIQWRVACWISKTTRAQRHASARAPKHTHTQKYVTLIAFSLQQWFPERASALRYRYKVVQI